MLQAAEARDKYNIRPTPIPKIVIERPLTSEEINERTHRMIK
jgi:hypothetical protein